MEKLISVPSYIYGEERLSSPQQRRVIRDFDQNPLIEVHDLDEVGLNGAIETACTAQNRLGEIEVEKIIRILERAMDFFFSDDALLEICVKLTGSSSVFTKEAYEFVKDWCRNPRPYLDRALDGTGDARVKFHNTAPTLVVLPSNADQEVLYVLAQVLLSRNATVVRPSSNGSGSFTALQFVRALNRAIDEAADPSLEVLKSSVSVINFPGRDFLTHLCMDGWSYIFFGDETTIEDIKKTIWKNCNARTVLGYGTGLSTCIVLDKPRDRKRINEIMEAITTNRGNECNSTDIVYIKEDIFDDVFAMLQEEARKYKSGDPFDPEKMGYLELENENFIIGELIRRGKIGYLNFTQERGRRLIHPSLIPLNRYETSLEYPGPIASIRRFGGLNELTYLIEKDLSDNGMKRSLVTAVFTDSKEKFDEVMPLLRAYLIKRNKPTHDFDILLPHQGIYLLEQLVEKIYIDE